MPALLAGYLAGYLREPALWQQALMLGLPWVTIVLGTVVIMLAVGYHSRGQTVDLGRAYGEAIRWVPRYVWTNVHNSLIFWAPIGLLVTARRWLAEALPTMWVPDVLVGGLSWLLIISVALFLHTRTLLALFLAVHADLPGTLAALEAWRLGGQHFVACFATLVLGTAGGRAIGAGRPGYRAQPTGRGSGRRPGRRPGSDLGWHPGSPAGTHSGSLPAVP